MIARLVLAELTLCALSSSAADVHEQGKLEVAEYCAVDRDEGHPVCVVTLDGDGRDPPQHSRDKAMDFWYQPEGKAHYLLPQHGALLAKGDLAEAGLAGCVAAPYTKGRLRIDDLPAGTHICVRTNAGRYSEIRIESFRPKSGAFTASYITWDN